VSSRKNSKVTLQDIADVLGISRGTVDRAIHNRGRISEITRREILDKASAMGYIDDKITRFTTLKKKVQILALFPESPSFFYDMMKTGLNAAVKEQNDSLVELKIIDYNPEDPAGFLNILKSSVQEELLKGVLLVPSGHFDPSLTLPEAAKIPYITINTDLPGSKRCCFIGQDLYQSGRLAGELIRKFCSEGKLLVLSGYEGLWAHDQRVRGVKDVLRDIGTGQNNTLLYCNDDIEKAAELVKDAFASDRDLRSVLALTAAASLGAVHALESMGADSRISLVGFDFNKELSKALDDGLCDALIGQNPELQGAYAFKLMYRILFNGYKFNNDYFVTPTELYFKELKPEHNSRSDFFI
jgi:LacI family transcriptional regulator, galactose operon repressor